MDWGKKYGAFYFHDSGGYIGIYYSLTCTQHVGDIMYYRVYDKHNVVLNSLEDCVELLERRSGIYSDRPYMPMLDLYAVFSVQFLCSLTNNTYILLGYRIRMEWQRYGTGLMPYGAKWRSYRRLYQTFLKAGAASRFHPTQTKKICDFLYGILTTPDDFTNHYRT